MAKENKKDRWYVIAVLDNLHTMTSGDVLSKEGDWFFKTNGQRYPHKGTIKLSKNESFAPEEPKPTLFATMTHKKVDPVVIHFTVKEKDPLKDDTMLDATINVHYEEKDQVHQLKSKDGKVTMAVRVIARKKPQW